MLSARDGGILSMGQPRVVILFAFLLILFALAVAGNLLLPVIWPTLGLALLLVVALGISRIIALRMARWRQRHMRRADAAHAPDVGPIRRSPGPAAGRRIRARMPESQQDHLFRALLARETARMRPVRLRPG